MYKNKKMSSKVLFVLALSYVAFVSSQDSANNAPSGQGFQGNLGPLPEATAPPIAPATQPPVSNSNPNPAGQNPTSPDKVGLRGVCLEDANCNVANSVCRQSIYGDGQSRCTCSEEYHEYQQNFGTSSCLKIVNVTDPRCQDCTKNSGHCLQKDSDVVCACPSSRSGANCEKILVNVQCENENMIVCYEPHENVNLANGWSVYTVNHVGIQSCTGGLEDVPKYCQPNQAVLKLPLRLNETSVCGTENRKSTLNNQFYNTIVVLGKNGSYVFNVFCSFEYYAVGKFSGIGVVFGDPSGSQGVEVKANLSLGVFLTDGRPLPMGAPIQVNDKVKFRITMEKGGIYSTFSVIRCVASSFYAIDSNSKNTETRLLMQDGCPVASEPTKDGWYWKESPGNNSLVTMDSGSVSMFKMSSSDTVYIDCTVKLCVQSNMADCTRKTPETCTTPSNGRRKRETSTPSEKTIRAELKVTGEKSDSQTGITGSSGSPTALVAVFSVIAALVILALVAGVIMLSANRKAVREGRQERFALPRLHNVHERF